MGKKELTFTKRKKDRTSARQRKKDLTITSHWGKETNKYQTRKIKTKVPDKEKMMTKTRNKIRKKLMKMIFLTK